MGLFQSYSSPGPGPPAWAGCSGTTWLEPKPRLGSREIEMKQRRVLECYRIAAQILVSPHCWHWGLNTDYSSKDGAGTETGLCRPIHTPQDGKWERQAHQSWSRPGPLPQEGGSNTPNSGQGEGLSLGHGQRALDIFRGTEKLGCAGWFYEVPISKKAILNLAKILNLYYRQKLFCLIFCHIPL